MLTNTYPTLLAPPTFTFTALECLFLGFTLLLALTALLFIVFEE